MSLLRRYLSKLCYVAVMCFVACIPNASLVAATTEQTAVVYLPMIMQPQSPSNLQNVEVRYVLVPGGPPGGLPVSSTMYIEGEVVNTTTTPLADVQVQVQLFDAQQNIINTVVVTPALRLSLPGQPNPFSAFLGPTPSPLPSYTVRIVGLREVANASVVPAAVPNVVVLGTENYGRFDTVSFSATIRNDTNQPMTNIIAVARAKGCGQLTSSSISSLAPGQTTTWRESLSCQGVPSPVSVKVDAQGTTVR